jgi:glycosyltransferase involved in cell wall biosynthesis
MPDARRPGHSLVSVVIPTFNRRGLVREAIDSVLRQDGASLEIFVVDDGSQDGTVAELERIGPPVVPVAIAHCGRVGKVRNVGIRLARGEFVAFLDSDDVWLPGKLARQLDYLASHPDIAVVYTNQYRVQQGRILPRTRFDHFAPRRRVLYRETVRGLCVQTSSVIARREVFDTIGLFDEEQVLYEDADMWSRLSERYELGFIETPLVLYRPDVDPGHLQADERVNLREAWRYYQKYAERRRMRVASAEEDAGTARFLGGLAAVAAELGEPWPPGECGGTLPESPHA